MKSIRFKFSSRRRAFTLVEMLLVITLISLLAALTLGIYTYAMRSSRRRVSEGTFEAIKLALDRYNTEFGEFPQAVGTNQMVSFPPGQTSYDVSGAACLYQALTGDGYDQIKGVTSTNSTSPSGSASGTSDGKVEGAAEIKNKMFADIPQTIFTRKGSTYILIDGFGHPFQYVKAAAVTPAAVQGVVATGGTPITVNSTYDLWSYQEDEKNTSKKSLDSQQDTTISAKWLKNW